MKRAREAPEFQGSCPKVTDSAAHGARHTSLRIRKFRQAFKLLVALLSACPLLPVAAWASGASDADDFKPIDSFSYFGEVVDSKSTWPSSTAWGLAFSKDFFPHFSASLAYLNDGHFPGHHRDGVAAELWIPVQWNRYLTLRAGAGPFYFFDTQNAANPNGYADIHSVAWLASLDAQLSLSGDSDAPGAFLEVRYDYASSVRGFETRSIGIGVGYRMYSDLSFGPFRSSSLLDDWLPHKQEIGIYGWKTVVNSFSSQHAAAAGIDYRFEIPAISSYVAQRAVPMPIRFSVGGVWEGDAQLVRRYGMIGEVWLEPTFWDERFSVGAGFGGYWAVDTYAPTPGGHVSGVVSITISARLDAFAGKLWPSFIRVKHVPAFLAPFFRSVHAGATRTDVRVIWDRMVTGYNRDTDVLLAGVDVRF